MKKEFKEALEDSPIIAAIKDDAGLTRCLDCDSQIIFILYGDIITISDEDGNEFDLELLDTIEFEGQTYCVFVPADIENMDVNDPDYGLIFLKSREENGEELFDSVDDDDELDRVYEYYQQIMEAEEEKE